MMIDDWQSRFRYIIANILLYISKYISISENISILEIYIALQKMTEANTFLNLKRLQYSYWLICNIFVFEDNANKYFVTHYFDSNFYFHYHLYMLIKIICYISSHFIMNIFLRYYPIKCYCWLSLSLI